MRNDCIVFLFMLLLSNVGCRKSVEYYYYKDGSVFSEVCEKDSLNQIYSYYSNGIMEHSSYALKKNDNIDGHFEAYYPDGFPKEKCEMKDGIGIGRPAETGKKDGYDIQIDFGPYEILENGKEVLPFRVFIDSLPMDEYFIGIIDSSYRDSFPHKMPKVLKQYTIYNEEKDSVNTVTIDETLYPYCIDDFQRVLLTNSRGEKCFMLNFYYKSVLREPYSYDCRMVVVYDSMHFKFAKVNLIKE